MEDTMIFKRHTAMSFVAPQRERRTLGPTGGENPFPKILGGQRIQKLTLPREAVEAISRNRIAGTGRVITASNFSEVRARVHVSADPLR